MAFTPYTSINLTQNELQNARIHYLASDPSTPVTGQLYFNSSSNKLRTWNGSTWDEYGTSTASGTVTGVSVVSANGFAGTVATSTTTPAITLTTTVTGLLKGNGTAISAATDTDVTGKLLTGYTSGAGTVSATDSILQGIQKLNGNIVALGTPVTSVVGTASRITVTGTTTATVDIAATYVGQTSITTLGTIATGTWNGSVIAGQYGGTGVANTGKTITLGGNLVTSGASSITLTSTGATNVTLPTTGTLATLAGAETLTNKIINAANNTIQGLDTGDFAAGVICDSAWNGTGLLDGGEDDASIPSAIVVFDTINARIAAAFESNDALLFKGVIDCSANPNYPAADAGFVYKVSVAGKIGGASGKNVQVGDTLYCITDTTASGNEATVGSNWVIVQNNLEAASTTVAGFVQLADATAAEAKSSSTLAVTPASLASFPIKKVFTSAASSSGLSTTVCTHNYGTRDITCQVYRTGTPYDQVLGEIEHTTTNTVTVKLYGTFGSGDFTIVTMG